MGKKNPGNRRKSSDSAKVAEKEEAVEEVKTETAVVDNEVLSEESGDENAAEHETEDKEAKEIEAPSDSLPVSPMLSDGKYRNKQRCLVLCSRGVTARYRHLLEDIRTLLPHHKKESKLDPGKDGMGQAVNDIADMRSCNTVLFLECRKHADAYLWMGRVGEKSGPSVRFHVTNIHTMDEMRLTGNCMKSSRPVLTFDESFDRVGHLKVLKELFVDVFGTPRGHPKSKPFVDRVMAFYYADKKVRYTSRLCENILSCICWVYDYIYDERMSDLRE
jgi:ribosome biogenesis protein BRX1